MTKLKEAPPQRSPEETSYQAFSTASWRGVVALYGDQRAEDVEADLLPDRLEKAPEERLFRDTRNRVWNVVCADQRTLTVKLNRATGGRKLSYLFRPSKGRRNFENAAALLRRGVFTPLPVAYFERHRYSAVQPNYYVAEFLDDAFSARDVFTAIEGGEGDRYRGVYVDSLLKFIGGFVCRMHDKGVFHRDLSSGNLLFALSGHRITPYLIDIGRARIKLRLTKLERLTDLMRICYKLSWADRETLVAAYETQLGESISGWRSAVKYFEKKQTSKSVLRPWR